MRFVSVICPILNEEKFIDKCVESIIAQDYPKNSLEVFFVDGMSTDNTRSKIQEYSKKYEYFKLLDNPKKVVPDALNIGIIASNGEVIIRLDGHCEYPSDYVSTLVRHLYELNADNVGAVLNTLHAKNNSVCRAIAIGSSHKFGVGDSKHKVGATKIIQTDTVPFGCYRREVFDRIGLFDEELIRNQDDEFNGRLKKNGGKIFLIPDLIIDYYARDTIQKLSKMNYQYGLFKPLVNSKLGAPTTIRQFFPVTFVLGLVIGAILSCLSKILLILYLCVIVLYGILTITFAVKSALNHKDWKLIFILPVVFFTIHISYGFGYLTGIFKIILKRKFNVLANR